MSMTRTLTRIAGIWFLTWGISSIVMSVLSSPDVKEGIKNSTKPLVDAGKSYMGKKNTICSSITENVCSSFDKPRSSAFSETISDPHDEEMMIKDGIMERIAEIEEELRELRGILN